VIIQCTTCQARYNYDESRFGGASLKRIKCTKCSTVFEIRNPAASGPPASPAARSEISPWADEFSLDETAMTAARKRSNLAAGGPGAPPRAAGPLASAVDATAGSLEGTGVIEPRGGTGGTDRVAASSATRQGLRPLRLPTEQRLSLACIAGPDSGRIFEIDKPRAVIGRANADILLADIQCSRQHAAIEVMDEHVFVVDLDSTNGTYVNDQRVTRVELENRAEFEIGATTLMLIRSYVRDGAGG
jgi:predicted Zn finger-like uncharacterized protein